MPRLWPFVLAFALAGAQASPLAQPAQRPAALTASDGSPGDGFGYSLAMSGGTLVVGAPAHDARGTDSGAAYVFVLGASATWVETQKLIPAELLTGDAFGWSVAIEGDLLVVGAPGDRRVNGLPAPDADERGAAYVYRLVNGLWVQDARLQPGELEAGDRFGHAVAVGDGSVFVGAPFAEALDYNGTAHTRAGAVYTFTRQIQGSGAATWVSAALQSKYFAAPLALFGAALSAGSGLLTVGKPGAAGWHSAGFDGGAMIFPQYDGTWGSGVDDSFNRDDHGNTVTQFRVGAGLEARLGSLTDIARTADGVAVLGYNTWRGFQFSWLASVGSAGVVSGFPNPLSGDAGVAAPALAVDGDATWLSVGYGIRCSGSDGLRSAGCPTAYCWGTESADGQGDAARFTSLRAIDIDPASRAALVIDGCAIRRVDTAMNVTTIAGAASECGSQRDGAGPAARFSKPVDLAVGNGVVYVADEQTIRVLDLSTLQVTWLTGQPCWPQLLDGGPAVACFSHLAGIAAGFGALYVSDASAIRKVTLDGQVTTLAGRVSGVPGDSWPVDGAGSSASMRPGRLVITGPGTVRFVEGSGLVREVTDAGLVRTVAGWPGMPTSGSLYGYTAQQSASTVAVGMPRGVTPLTADRTGAAWVARREYGRPAEAVWPRDAHDGDGYGTAVTITRDGVLALGPANGPLYFGAGFVDPGDDVEPVMLFWQPRGTLWELWTGLPVPSVSPTSGYGSALSSSGTLLAIGAPHDAAGQVFVHDLSMLDADADTLPDLWELQLGLDPTSGTGADGATGDHDGDGVTNADEHEARSHPANDAAATWHFAEGATSDFFETEFAVVNAGQDDARVLFRFMTADGRSVSHGQNVPARARRTVAVGDLPGMTRAEFATTVESDRPIAVDRVMSWHAARWPDGASASPDQRIYGTHGQSGVAAPATTWFLAEGTTLPGFDLFYLLQNPGEVAADLRVRYLLTDDPPVERTCRVAPRSRLTIWVNEEEIPPASGVFPLRNRELSAEITSTNDVPVLVERAMYLTRPGAASVTGGAFEAGHASAGVTSPATEWFLAEGATGPFFDLFVLVANPGSVDAEVEATFLLPDGSTVLRPHTVRAGRRFNIWVDHEDPRLADTAVSTTVRSLNGVPIVVERAMWWPGPTPASWSEAHNSPGATSAATRWVAAAGRFRKGVLGAPDVATYYLVANPGDTVAYVGVTLLFDDGTPPVTTYVTVPPHSRLNVVPGGDVAGPDPNGIIVLPDRDRRFAAVFDAYETPVVVEWAIYGDGLGRFWASGANAPATRLR
jgi:hypothetical protein